MPPSRHRVTFDSNVWEKVFDPDDGRYAPIRDAVTSGAIEGYICEAGFRIEAIMKRHRPTYFAQPHMDVTVDIRPLGNGQFELLMSMGPDDGKHPGLHDVQVRKFRSALDACRGKATGQGLRGMGRWRVDSSPYRGSERRYLHGRPGSKRWQIGL